MDILHQDTKIEYTNETETGRCDVQTPTVKLLKY